MLLQRDRAAGPALGICATDGAPDWLVEPLAGDESRIDGQPCAELSAHRAELRIKPAEVGPRMARIDVVGRHRRDAAQIVDACRDEFTQRAGQQVGWRLQADLRGEQAARERDDAQEVFCRRLFTCRRTGACVGAEVLNDDLLDMAIPAVQVGDRGEGVDGLLERLADADEEAAREGDAELPGPLRHGDPNGRALVWRPVVHLPWLAESLAHRLEHEAHGGVDGADEAELIFAQDARVGVGDEAVSERLFTGPSEVVRGALKAPGCEQPTIAREGGLRARVRVISSGDIVQTPWSSGERRKAQ